MKKRLKLWESFTEGSWRQIDRVEYYELINSRKKEHFTQADTKSIKSYFPEKAWANTLTDTGFCTFDHYNLSEVDLIKLQDEWFLVKAYLRRKLENLSIPHPLVGRVYSFYICDELGGLLDLLGNRLETNKIEERFSFESSSKSFLFEGSKTPFNKSSEKEVNDFEQSYSAEQFNEQEKLQLRQELEKIFHPIPIYLESDLTKGDLEKKIEIKTAKFNMIIKVYLLNSPEKDHHDFTIFIFKRQDEYYTLSLLWYASITWDFWICDEFDGLKACLHHLKDNKYFEKDHDKAR